MEASPFGNELGVDDEPVNFGLSKGTFVRTISYGEGSHTYLRLRVTIGLVCGFEGGLRSA